MEQVKHNTAAGDSLKLYASPRTKVVFLKKQGVLCVSNPDVIQVDTAYDRKKKRIRSGAELALNQSSDT